MFCNCTNVDNVPCGHSLSSTFFMRFVFVKVAIDSNFNLILFRSLKKIDDNSKKLTL